MDETLQEFVDARDVALRVDAASGVIRGIKILGLASRNGRAYLPDALRQAVALYEDAKVNVNHPKGDPAAPRDYQDRIGVIRNVAFREGEGLFGELHYNPKHALAEQLLWDAKHAPHNVGFSHNVQARTARRGDELVVETITRVVSVDLVADPATTRGLYEAEPPRPTLDQLKKDYPELIVALEQEQAAELQQLREQVEQLRAAAAACRKELAMRKLLRQFDLPEPETVDTASRAICSRPFVESLLAAEDEQAMRALVEERAALVRRLGGKPDAMHNLGRPVSREGRPWDAPTALSTKTFVEAIVGA